MVIYIIIIINGKLFLRSVKNRGAEGDFEKNSEQCP
jgi:hypothetical protein